MVALILIGLIAGLILRWIVIRRMRVFIRNEVNAALVGAAGAKLLMKE